MLTPKTIIFLSIILLIIFYFTTNEKSSILGKKVWPIDKNQRVNKLIQFNIYGDERDNTVIDGFSLTHISHGILLYYILKLFNKDSKYNFYIAFTIHLLWEIIENTEYFINIYKKYFKEDSRYQRRGKYIGDSIVNILSDIILMIIGYQFAEKYTNAYMYIIISELLLYFKFNDNLIISIRDILFAPITILCN